MLQFRGAVGQAEAALQDVGQERGRTGRRRPVAVIEAKQPDFVELQAGGFFEGE